MVAMDRQTLLVILSQLPDPKAKLSDEMIYVPLQGGAPVPFKKIEFAKANGSIEWMYAPCFLAMLHTPLQASKPRAMLVPYVDEEIWAQAKASKEEKKSIIL